MSNENIQETTQISSLGTLMEEIGWNANLSRCVEILDIAKKTVDFTQDSRITANVTSQLFLFSEGNHFEGGEVGELLEYIIEKDYLYNDKNSAEKCIVNCSNVEKIPLLVKNGYIRKIFSEMMKREDGTTRAWVFITEILDAYSSPDYFRNSIYKSPSVILSMFSSLLDSPGRSELCDQARKRGLRIEVGLEDILHKVSNRGIVGDR